MGKLILFFLFSISVLLQGCFVYGDKKNISLEKVIVSKTSLDASVSSTNISGAQLTINGSGLLGVNKVQVIGSGTDLTLNIVSVTNATIVASSASNLSLVGSYTLILETPEAKGEFAISFAATAYRYWRFKTTGGGADNQGNSVSEMKLYYNGSWNSLVGKTLTNIGGVFHGAYPLSNMNDGIAEVANATSLSHVPVANGDMDIYIDLNSAITVSGIQIAPQGVQNTITYNTPLEFTVYASSDASTWTQKFSVNAISAGYPNWNAGSYRSWTW